MTSSPAGRRSGLHPESPVLLEHAARLTGSRIVLAPHDSPRMILKCFRRDSACIVRVSADGREEAYAFSGKRVLVTGRYLDDKVRDLRG